MHQTVPPLSKVPSEVSHYLLEYRKFNAAPMKVKPVRVEKWKPSDTGCLKTNFDGAVFADSGEARIGVVIRDSRGQVLASLSERIPNPSSVAVLELLAARHAITLVKELGLDGIVLEGNSEIINALENGDMFNSTYGHLLINTLSLLNSLKS